MNMPKLEQLAKHYRFNETLLETVSKDFSEEDWKARAGDSNPAIWILFHIASTRRHLLRMIGVEAKELEWEKIVSMGSKENDGSGLPSPEVAFKEFAESGERIERCLSTLPNDEADAEREFSFPDGSNTLTRAAGFLFMHEAYHLGQLGLLRRMCGKAGFA
jgi:uncharacterized damage-inducible protein DinB